MIEDNIFFPSLISSPIGYGKHSEPNDIINTRKNLNKVGIYEADDFDAPLIDTD